MKDPSWTLVALEILIVVEFPSEQRRKLILIKFIILP